MDIQSLAKHIDLKVQYGTMIDQLVVTSGSYETSTPFPTYDIYDGRPSVIAMRGTGSVIDGSFDYGAQSGLRVGVLFIFAMEDVAGVSGSAVTVHPYDGVNVYHQLLNEHLGLADSSDWFTGGTVRWGHDGSVSSFNPGNPTVTRTLPTGTHDLRIELHQAEDVPWVSSGNPSAVTRVTVP